IVLNLLSSPPPDITVRLDRAYKSIYCNLDAQGQVQSQRQAPHDPSFAAWKSLFTQAKGFLSDQTRRDPNNRMTWLNWANCLESIVGLHLEVKNCSAEQNCRGVRASRRLFAQRNLQRVRDFLSMESDYEATLQAYHPNLSLSREQRDKKTKEVQLGTL